MTEKTAFNIKKMKEEENFNFNVKDVISWSNNQDANQYIGHEGYFGDSLSELDLAVYNGNIFTLNVVSVGASQCFYSVERGAYFGFFLPEDKAKEVKKEEKYRPFTVDEIGVICMSYYRFRNKKTKDEYMGMLTGVIRKSAENESDIVCIGCFQGSLEELFEQYELMGENEQWQPFGIKE